MLKISWTELILWCIRLKFESKNYLWTKIEPKRKYKWLQAKRSEDAEGVFAERREAPFTIYSWTIRIMFFVKVLKYIIAICSLVLCRGFLILCVILVYSILMYLFSELYRTIYAGLKLFDMNEVKKILVNSLSYSMIRIPSAWTSPKSNCKSLQYLNTP